MAKKKKFQTRLMAIEIGEMLAANEWFSLTCLITVSIVKKEMMITIVVRKE